MAECLLPGHLCYKNKYKHIKQNNGYNNKRNLTTKSSFWRFASCTTTFLLNTFSSLLQFEIFHVTNFYKGISKLTETKTRTILTIK